MNQTRTQAHEAMRNLWDTANTRVQSADIVEREGYAFQDLETESGAEIHKVDGHLSVMADFVRSDGVEESVAISFPADIRDLSMSEVRIDWVSETDSGTNTPPLRDFPQLAGELLALL